MAIKIAIGYKVGIKVVGTYNDDKGIKQPFDFTLTCLRMSDEDYNSKVQSSPSDATVTDFMIDVTEDWDNVRGEDNAKLPYSGDNLRELFKIPGIGRLAFDTYRAEAGVKAKN
jgi:hypothetical protein